MMNIYRMKAKTNTYDVIDLDIINMMQKLKVITNHDEDTLIELLMNLPLDNTSLKGMWPEEMTCSYFGKAKEQNYDINLFSHFLVLKMNAYSVLSEHLKPYGEFLPLNVEGDKIMMFNLLTFAQENKELCEMSYLDGFENGLSTLHFNEDDIVSKSIFKSKLEGAMAIFCTDYFKELVEKNRLNGVVFDTNLLDIF